MMNDPSNSLDPVIQNAVARQQHLIMEQQRLDHLLSLYVSRPEPKVMASPAVPLSQHYNMDENHLCSCLTCAEWVMRREEFVEAVKLVPKGHKWSTCSCMSCRFVGRIQMNYLAAANTRDLVIEMSYHGHYHSPFGEKVMAWLDDELRQPNYTTNWRAQELNRFPMERWIRKCEAALSPIVSGQVFRDSMMVTDLRVHFGSSLMAEGEFAFG